MFCSSFSWMERMKDVIFMKNNKQIVKALTSGDKVIFEKVYRHYYQWLCSFGSQYVSLDEAEEIVQDTMLWLWENRTSLNPNLSLKSFLFTIVKNKALNQIHHSHIKRRAYDAIALEHKEEFENPKFYMENELFVLYKKALTKLDPKLREAYELTRKKNLTHKQIAEMLNVSHQTVNYRIGQALKSLRVELKDYLPLLAFLFC